MMLAYIRAIVVSAAIVAAIVLLIPAHGQGAVKSGNEMCVHVRTRLMIGEDMMRHLFVCNTGLVSLANRLRTRAETLDPNERCHRATIHIGIRIDGHRVVLRWVWTCTSGIVMYGNRLG